MLDLEGYTSRDIDIVAECPDENILPKICDILGRIGISNCIDMKIQQIHWMDFKYQNSRPRPIIVRFMSGIRIKKECCHRMPT